MIVGQIVGGSNTELIIREKKGVGLELGDLLAVEDGSRKYLYMVSALEYGSLVGEDRLFTSSGSMLEGTKPNVEIPEKDLRLFRKVHVSPLLEVREEGGQLIPKSPRAIPVFLSKARDITKEDFSFLQKPETEIFLGKIRSGTKVLDFDYHLNGEDMLSHHALISAQTGRGKSNLVKVMLWEAMRHNRFGILVMDIHNEYFGVGSSKGLRNHPNASRSLVQYSKNPPTGQKRLVINLRALLPSVTTLVLDMNVESSTKSSFFILSNLLQYTLFRTRAKVGVFIIVFDPPSIADMAKSSDESSSYTISATQRSSSVPSNPWAIVLSGKLRLFFTDSEMRSR